MIRGALAVTTVGTIVAGLIITGHHPHHTRSASGGSAPTPTPTVTPTRPSRAEHRHALRVVKPAVAPKRIARPATRSGDDLNWSALAQCEASGNPRAVDPTGTYFGLYQFDILTWRSVGGRGNPADASRAEQTLRARILYGQRGRTPWPVCGVRL